MSDTIVAEDVKNVNCEVVLKSVINSIKEQGYNPATQLAAYLSSGEPLFITKHNGARNMIQNFDRIELLEKVINIIMEKL